MDFLQGTKMVVFKVKKKYKPETAAEKHNRELANKLHELARKWVSGIYTPTEFVTRARQVSNQVRQVSGFDDAFRQKQDFLNQEKEKQRGYI